MQVKDVYCTHPHATILEDIFQNNCQHHLVLPVYSFLQVLLLNYLRTLRSVLCSTCLYPSRSDRANNIRRRIPIMKFHIKQFSPDLYCFLAINSKYISLLYSLTSFYLKTQVCLSVEMFCF